MGIPEATPREQESAERKALLEGIVDTDDQALVSLVTSHQGTLLVLGETIDTALEKLSHAEDMEFTKWLTFVFTQKLPIRLMKQQKYIRAGWVIDIVEVTEEMWENMLLDQGNRLAQMAINSSPLKVQ